MKSLLIFCVIITISIANPINVAKIFKEFSCDKTDPQLDKCLLTAVRKSLPEWLEGIPELGIPPMDPLTIKEITFDEIAAEFVNVSATFTDMEIRGIKNTIVQSIKVDPDNMYGSVRLSIPWVHIITDYKVDGKFAVVPIQNSGHFVGNFTDINIYSKASLTTYKQDNGLKYHKINKILLNITIGDGHIKIDSKDKTMQASVDMMTSFFNQNSHAVLENFSPLLSETAQKMSQRIIDNLLSLFPIPE